MTQTVALVTSDIKQLLIVAGQGTYRKTKLESGGGQIVDYAFKFYLDLVISSSEFATPPLFICRCYGDEMVLAGGGGWGVIKLVIYGMDALLSM